ncbi:MAG: tetratricopeptide repeat protein [Bacteroidetes bacterium]|nr:tetratricopeptide repeat protein [Bacteroidota bacterium]
MAEEIEEVQSTQVGDPEEGSFYYESEDWFERNRQKLMIGGGAALILVAAVIFILAKWLPERNLNADRALFPAESMFARDSFDLALNGGKDGPGGVPYKGFLEIKKKYSFTRAANLCNMYIGICYLNKKDYKNAVEYLNSYSTSDPVVGAAKLNLIGDAYADQNKSDDAASYYKKAAEFSGNQQFTPMYLLKLGKYYESLKKYNDAKETYTKLKEKYPNTMEGQEVDKYLARLSTES